MTQKLVFPNLAKARELQAKSVNEDLANRLQVEPTRGWRIPQIGDPLERHARLDCPACFKPKDEPHGPGCYFDRQVD